MALFLPALLVKAAILGMIACRHNGYVTEIDQTHCVLGGFTPDQEWEIHKDIVSYPVLGMDEPHRFPQFETINGMLVVTVTL